MRPSGGKLTAAGLRKFLESHSDVHPSITRRLHGSGIFENLKNLIVDASKKHLAPLLKKGVGAVLGRFGKKKEEEKEGGKITGGKMHKKHHNKKKSMSDEKEHDKKHLRPKRKINPELLKRSRAMGKLMKNGKMNMKQASEYYADHKHEF